MISLFIGNPYFAEVCDAVRVGDMYTTRADPRSAMFGRAAIFKLAMAGALIDTDGQLRFCLRDDYRDLLDDQLAVGVPTLYNAELLMRRPCPGHDSVPNHDRRGLRRHPQDAGAILSAGRSRTVTRTARRRNNLFKPTACEGLQVEHIDRTAAVEVGSIAPAIGHIAGRIEPLGTEQGEVGQIDFIVHVQIRDQPHCRGKPTIGCPPSRRAEQVIGRLHCRYHRTHMSHQGWGRHL